MQSPRKRTVKHYYSVQIHGENAESEAINIFNAFTSRRPDYTGHPFFYVANHSGPDDFQSKVDGMLSDGHTASVRKITKATYEGR